MAAFKHIIFAMAAFVAAIFVSAALVPVTAQSAKRSGVGPCRQAALSIISMLDSKEDNTADYRHAFDGIVQTCGPVTSPPRPAPSPSDRKDCGKLALAVLDAIEDGKINTPVFVQARARFAESCAPR
jgi:hypothetical protein